MTTRLPAFARDRDTARYYDQRAGEYDDWYTGEGRFGERDRPGWHEAVAEIGGRVLLDGPWFVAAVR